ISGGTSSATSFNDNGGKYQFTQDALWSDLRAGTTIILRAANSTVTEAAYDEDPADYRLDINLLYQKSSKYITYISGSFNLQNYDMVVLKGGSSANLYDNSIHIFAAGVNSSYLPAYDALPSPKLASTVFLNGNATSTGYQYAISTTQSTNDFNGRGTSFVGNSTTTAPVWGNGHPGSNADYITSLRPVVDNQPVIRSDQDYVISENSPSGTVVGKAVANLASAGTLSNWAILYGNTNNMFAIDKATGIITLTGNAVPDFETLPVYYLTIEVYNGAIRSNSVQIIINVENMNEVPAAPGIFGMTAGKLNGFRPEVSGTAEYNSKIALYVDDVLVTDTITTTETRATWTHKITEAMSPGVHTFYFTATGIDNISLESPKTEVLMMLENFDIIANNILT
ncbi:MAG: cadherin repeat domain-containing protein, partial [Sphingobacteriales bacterium]